MQQAKARKEAKAAAAENKKPAIVDQPSQPVVKCNVNTQELLRQAEAVATSTKPGLKIPDSIVRVLERAIDARKRCAAWFRKTGIHSEESSTESHLHFVGVLEKALNSLEPNT